jgi:NifU-like protein
MAWRLLASEVMSDDAIGLAPLSEPSTPGTESLTPVKRARPRLDSPESVAIIQEVIDSLRPAFQADGGDCLLLEVLEDRVLVRMTGACQGCQMASATLTGLQAKLMGRLNRLVRVIPVPPGH